MREEFCVDACFFKTYDVLELKTSHQHQQILIVKVCKNGMLYTQIRMKSEAKYQERSILPYHLYDLLFGHKWQKNLHGSNDVPGP
jgi:hypothetical protein